MILELRDCAELVVIQEAIGHTRLYFHGSGATVCCQSPLAKTFPATDRIFRSLATLKGPVTQMVTDGEGSGVCFVVSRAGWPHTFLDLAEAMDFAAEIGTMVNFTRFGER